MKGRFGPIRHDILNGSGCVAVFDLDGTLVDTAPDLAAALNHCLGRVGIAELTLEVARPFAGHGARAMLAEAYRRAGKPFAEADAEAHLPHFLRFYEDNIAVASRPFPGVLEAMERLHEEGWLLAICTNKTERLARRLIAELGLPVPFAAICGADTFPERKPDPRHLTGTIAAAGAEPARSIMVGDTITDMATAQAAGVPGVLVSFGYGPDEASRAAATVILHDYADLGPALAERLLANRRKQG